MKEPKKLKRVIIKEELVVLTGDYIKAVLLQQMILQQMIYWSERVNTEIQNDWIYKSAKELSEETMLDLKPNTIRKHIKELINKGYLKERQNPIYKWDRTKQYRIDLCKIQSDLLKLGFNKEVISCYGGL